MRTIKTDTYDATREKATAVILTTLKNSETCLVKTEGSYNITTMQVGYSITTKLDSWSPLTFAG